MATPEARSTASGSTNAQAPTTGAGRRLIAGFEALENLPAIAESRNRLIGIGSRSRCSPGDVATVVEADVALTMRVLRAANRGSGVDRDKVTTVAEAVEALSAEAVVEIAAQTPAIDFFHRGDRFGQEVERVRLHGVATQQAMDLLARELHLPRRDELVVSALLHDIGKLVLKVASAPDRAGLKEDGAPPEERIRAERGELGLDHAVIGGVIARRWRLPQRIASAIELHHAADAAGDPAIVRLADMLVHYARGSAVSPTELLSVARRLGLAGERLRRLLYELPHHAARTTRESEPCPLTPRELEAVKGLARGEVYKEIGQRLSLAPSTVRTHLHKAYKKLGVEDRAQAVLAATKEGWI